MTELEPSHGCKLGCTTQNGHQPRERGSGEKTRKPIRNRRSGQAERRGNIQDYANLMYYIRDLVSNKIMNNKKHGGEDYKRYFTLNTRIPYDYFTNCEYAIEEVKHVE
ncbi:MAG TPA: hypothetical protein VFI73_11365 [Candidatus Nitrosopolaris sp.]|nr:hypothetical protein [Candidatus Nitrosopolaris sp.]